MFVFHSQNRKGQTIIELIVAISIVVVSLLGIFALISRSLAINRLTSEQYAASYLAAEGIELVRNMFDHSFIATVENHAGEHEFYGFVGPEKIELVADPNKVYEVYEIDYDDGDLVNHNAVSCPLGGEPTQGAMRTLFADCDLQFLNFDAGTGLYSYEPAGGANQPTKFKRVVIVDIPLEFASVPAGANLDFRVISAVGWASRGGQFMVAAQDHFLPWRPL